MVFKYVLAALPPCLMRAASIERGAGDMSSNTTAAGFKMLSTSQLQLTDTPLYVINYFETVAAALLAALKQYETVSAEDTS